MGTDQSCRPILRQIVVGVTGDQFRHLVALADAHLVTRLRRHSSRYREAESFQVFDVVRVCEAPHYGRTLLADFGDFRIECGQTFFQLTHLLSPFEEAVVSLLPRSGHGLDLEIHGVDLHELRFHGVGELRFHGGDSCLHVRESIKDRNHSVLQATQGLQLAISFHEPVESPLRLIGHVWRYVATTGGVH